MAESAALLVDEVLPHVPIRQWVISFSFQLRYLFARYPKAMSQALAIAYCSIATHLIKKAGLTHKTAKTGGMTLIQRFGSALNLNPREGGGNLGRFELTMVRKGVYIP